MIDNEKKSLLEPNRTNPFQAVGSLTIVRKIMKGGFLLTSLTENNWAGEVIADPLINNS